MSSGPPNKFPKWVDLSKFSDGQQKADAMGNAYQEFFDFYGVWPHDSQVIGNVLYLGAYGWPTNSQG
jgi:hypothetical protein